MPLRSCVNTFIPHTCLSILIKIWVELIGAVCDVVTQWGSSRVVCRQLEVEEEEAVLVGCPLWAADHD